MHQSLVTQSAINAMRDARLKPELQPSLALLRNLNPAFFQDLEDTLQKVPEAPDLTVFREHALRDFRFMGADLRRWLKLRPNGVIYPITIAASNEPGTLAAPMRLLLLVPVRCESLLQDTRNLAYMLVKEIWANDNLIAQGENAAFLVGMYAHEDGTWEYGPVVGWAAAAEGHEDARAQGLPVVPDLVEQRMISENLDFPEALNAMMADYFFDEIGFLLLSDLPEGQTAKS